MEVIMNCDVEKIGRKLSSLIKKFGMEYELTYIPEKEAILIDDTVSYEYDDGRTDGWYWYLEYCKIVIGKKYFMLEDDSGYKLYVFSNGEYDVTEPPRISLIDIMVFFDDTNFGNKVKFDLEDNIIQINNNYTFKIEVDRTMISKFENSISIHDNMPTGIYLDLYKDGRVEIRNMFDEDNVIEI